MQLDDTPIDGLDSFEVAFGKLQPESHVRVKTVDLLGVSSTLTIKQNADYWGGCKLERKGPGMTSVTPLGL